MKALLLENIHPEGIRLLTERGIEVETVKGALDERLRQLLEQAVLSEQVVRLLVIFQQLVKQFG